MNTPRAKNTPLPPNSTRFRNRAVALSIGIMGCLSAPVVAAVPSIYGSFNVPLLKYTAPGASATDDDITATHESLSLYIAQPYIHGLGVQFHENFAIEARFGFDLGLEEELNETFFVDIYENGTYIEFVEAQTKITSILSAYLRVGLPLEWLQPYVLVGTTRVTTEIESSEIELHFSTAESSMSYGIGFDIDLMGNDILRFEWTKIFDKDDVEISGILIGYKYTIN